MTRTTIRSRNFYSSQIIFFHVLEDTDFLPFFFRLRFENFLSRKNIIVILGGLVRKFSVRRRGRNGPRVLIGID